MERITDTEAKVKMILQNCPESREDDFVLIQLFKNYYFTWNSWKDVFNNHREIGFPSFETITRCRRKLQATYPNLQASKVVDARAEMEREFEEYALS